jgi:hypothetical protein
MIVEAISAVISVPSRRRGILARDEALPRGDHVLDALSHDLARPRVEEGHRLADELGDVVVTE